MTLEPFKIVLLGSSLRDRIPLSYRPWLALSVLLCPIVESIITGARANEGDGYKLNLTFALVLYMAFKWAVYLPNALYWGTYGEILAFWRGFHPFNIFSGFFWFFILRAGSIAFVLPFALAYAAYIGPLEMEKQQHRMAKMMPFAQFHDHPIHSMFIFTLISMVAGFCEETWRYGMFRIASQLAPKIFYNSEGKLLVIFVVSLVFGSAHIYEGVLGVVTTFFLGFGLGSVMLYRRSFWEASLAHFFTDASVGCLLLMLGILNLHLPGL